MSVETLPAPVDRSTGDDLVHIICRADDGHGLCGVPITREVDNVDYGPRDCVVCAELAALRECGRCSS